MQEDPIIRFNDAHVALLEALKLSVARDHGDRFSKVKNILRNDPQSLVTPMYLATPLVAATEVFLYHNKDTWDNADITMAANNFKNLLQVIKDTLREQKMSDDAIHKFMDKFINAPSVLLKGESPEKFTWHKLVAQRGELIESPSIDEIVDLYVDKSWYYQQGKEELLKKFRKSINEGSRIEVKK